MSSPTDNRAQFGVLGFRYPDNIIMNYLGGSATHGAKLPGKSDTDWYGVYIEPPNHVMGLTDYPHWTYTTSNGEGNTAADVDACFYSLRKWAGLAVKGNPSCLHFLFAPKQFENVFWVLIDIRKNLFVSKDSMSPFLGFADSQLKRLFGEKGQKNVNRVDLETEFGYDTKYAMHVVRLFCEARELMETGTITLPRPEKELLIDIRLGKYKLFEIREMAEHAEQMALAAREKSPLPEHIDREAITNLITHTQLQFWEWQRDLVGYVRQPWDPKNGK